MTPTIVPYFIKSLSLTLLISLYSGCSTKEQFYEGMYEGFKTGNRMNVPKEAADDGDRAIDVDHRQYRDEKDYSEYKEAIEGTKF